MRRVPESGRESPRPVDVGSVTVLKTPLFESVSVSVSSSDSPVRLFVMRTTSVSIFVPFTLASVSRIVVGSESPGSIVVGYVAACVVSLHATRILPERDESVPVCVSM